MGDKKRRRALQSEKPGAMTPGSDGIVETESARSIAKKIGYTVMLKRPAAVAERNCRGAHKNPALQSAFHKRAFMTPRKLAENDQGVSREAHHQSASVNSDCCDVMGHTVAFGRTRLFH